MDSSLLYPPRVAWPLLSLNDSNTMFFEIKPAGKKNPNLPGSWLLCGSHGQGRRRVSEANRASVKCRSVVSGLLLERVTVNLSMVQCGMFGPGSTNNQTWQTVNHIYTNFVFDTKIKLLRAIKLAFPKTCSNFSLSPIFFLSLFVIRPLSLSFFSDTVLIFC